ncbi:MAG: type II toxin-antitoxin system HicA family toxin [Spirochaetia bacterium]|jgi:hypothetical protein|nr:type II toxin-antitoxin system HicA family toxin [Spirochaetia bacterium]
MSKHDKIVKKLNSRPKNFTYSELHQLLTGFGYIESHKGKTSGSRVAFINEKADHIIRLHKPHPGNELKQYQISLIINELKTQGLLEGK